MNSSNYNSWQLHFTDKAYLIAQVNSDELQGPVQTGSCKD